MKRIALATGLVLALGFTSVAAGDHRDRRDTFVGECSGEGFVFYPTSSERLETDARKVDVRVEADVECTGELNGEPIADSTAYMTAAKDDERFGVGGDGDKDEGRLDDLPGNLKFVGANGHKLFTRMTSMNPQQTLLIEGRRDGEADGTLQPENGPRVITRADTVGSRVVIFTVEFETDSEGISD